MRKQFLLIVTVGSLVGCASGSALVVDGKSRPAINPESVKIYVDPPASYEIIAIVKASSDAGLTEQGSLEYAVEEIKRQAAKVGANGVLVGGTGSKTSSVMMSSGSGFLYGIPFDAQVIQGSAIFVRE